MAWTGVKIGCKIRPAGPDRKLLPGYDAIAYIKEGKYDENFTAHFGAVEVACTASEMVGLVNAGNRGPVFLHLLDNRLVEVKLFGAHGSELVVIQGETVSEDHKQIYFVATSPLGDEPKPQTS